MLVFIVSGTATSAEKRSGLDAGNSCEVSYEFVFHSKGMQSTIYNYNNKTCLNAVCGDQDCKETSGLFASEGHSAAQRPISHSAYINTALPTSPCDAASAASVAYLPTSLSDFSNSAADKSREGLTYATVCFHYNASSSDDAAPKIGFKKEEELCEYATVSHGN